uniref:Uncharacterized protein n=1 Tax=Helianthus annuus TaxID=4232 RepID=A0A251UNG3_HELAN
MGRTNSQGGSLDWLRWAADLLIGLHIERKRRGCQKRNQLLGGHYLILSNIDEQKTSDIRGQIRREFDGSFGDRRIRRKQGNNEHQPHGRRRYLEREVRSAVKRGRVQDSKLQLRFKSGFTTRANA